MESIFPPIKWPQLAHPDAEEPGANEYKGRLYWEYCDILEDGSWSTEEDDDRYFDFWSYKYDAHSYSACGDNQAITSIHISDDITRKIRDQTPH